MLSLTASGRGFFWCAAVLVVTGCATIAPMKPVSSDQTLGVVQTEVEVNGAVATINQESELEVFLSASHSCELREQQKVVRTTTAESENRTPGPDWIALGAGVVAATAGAIVVVDAGNVYPHDRSAQNYNSVGPGGAKAIGFSLIGIGAVLLAIPTVDAIRANQDTVNTQEVTTEGTVKKRYLACKNRPYAAAEVSLELVGKRLVTVGTTDKAGRLDIAIEEAIPEDAVMRTDVLAKVLVDSFEVGRINVKPLLVRREAKLWAKASPSCRNVIAANSCGLVTDLLARYPDGPHAKQAQDLLEKAKGPLDAIEAATLFAALDLRACDKPSKNTELPILTGSCSRLARYLDRFPRSEHAQTVSAALEIGRARIDELQAKDAAQYAADQRKAAQAERKQQEQEEAEQRRQDAAQRRLEAAQSAGGRERCRARCRVGCSNTLRFEICESSCIRMQCQ